MRSDMPNNGEVFSCEFVGKLISVNAGPAIGDHIRKRIVADVEIERDRNGYGRVRMTMRIPLSDDDLGSLTLSNSALNNELILTGEKPIGFR